MSCPLYLCFRPDTVAGPAARGPGPPLVGPGRGSEEGGGQVAGGGQGEDGPFCERHHPRQTARRAPESQRVPKKQGVLGVDVTFWGDIQKSCLDSASIRIE